jgi:hypothetical protein
LRLSTRLLAAGGGEKEGNFTRVFTPGINRKMPIPWNPTTVDFQFSKSGPWIPCINFPHNPIITKPLETIPIIESPLEINQTINVIKQLIPEYNEFLDNPILIINKLEKIKLTNAKRAHHYRYLYLYAKKNYSKFTLKDLYKRYYHDYCLVGLGYSWKEKELINKAKDSDILVSELYKNIFFEYSRYYY